MPRVDGVERVFYSRASSTARYGIKGMRVCSSDGVNGRRGGFDDATRPWWLDNNHVLSDVKR